MVHAHDTALRYLALLQLLPVYPKSRSTQDIAERLLLRSAEFAVSRRTLQRDLDKLSAVFPIGCDIVGRRYDWYWTDRHALTQIPDMNASSALALCLAEAYLSNLLPATSLKNLAVYFSRARQILAESKLGRWSHKIHLISNTSLLHPPSSNPPFNILSTKHCWRVSNYKFNITHVIERHHDTISYSPLVSSFVTVCFIWLRDRLSTMNPIITVYIAWCLRVYCQRLFGSPRPSV